MAGENTVQQPPRRQIADPDEVLILCPACLRGVEHPAGWPDHKVDPANLGVRFVNVGALIGWTAMLTLELARVLTRRSGPAPMPAGE